MKSSLAAGWHSQPTVHELVAEGRLAHVRIGNNSIAIPAGDRLAQN